MGFYSEIYTFPQPPNRYYRFLVVTNPFIHYKRNINIAVFLGQPFANEPKRYALFICIGKSLAFTSSKYFFAIEIISSLVSIAIAPLFVQKYFVFFHLSNIGPFYFCSQDSAPLC